MKIEYKPTNYVFEVYGIFAESVGKRKVDSIAFCNRKADSGNVGFMCIESGFVGGSVFVEWGGLEVEGDMGCVGEVVLELGEFVD